MKNKGIKIGMLIWGVLIAILLIRFSIFIFDLSFLRDPVSSEAILLIILALGAILFLPILNRKYKFLNYKVNIITSLLIMVIFSALFAPVITPFAPDQIIKTGECRLLPPLAGKIILFKKSDTQNPGAIELLPVDSLKYSTEAILYKNGKKVELNRDLLQAEKGNIKVRKAFFLLGTDEFGRDLFARILYGARVSLLIGFTAALLSFLIACFLTFISTRPIRILDMITNRITEIFLAIPSLFVIIFAISLFGHNLSALIIVLAITSWMSLFKILNGEIKRLIGKDFIVTSKMLKLPGSRIFIREILPLIIPSIIVNIIFQVANFIIIESSLSFLGLGPGNEYPSWGGIIESGLTYLSSAWWMIFFPGLILILTILGLNKTGSILETEFNPLLK